MKHSSLGILCLFIVATMVSTYVGGRMAIRLRNKLNLVVSFSAGAVLGLVLLDLLPEAMALSVPRYPPARVTSLVALGFLLFMVLNRIVLHESDHGEQGRGGPPRRRRRFAGWREPQPGELGAGGLCVHSFLDGMGIGLGLKISLTVGLLITAGVITHDFADGINTVSIILSHRGTVRQASGWLAADALSPALGAVATQFFTVSHSALGLALALFSGFFLYVGASELLPEGHRLSRSLWPTLLTLLGFGTLYVAIRLTRL